MEKADGLKYCTLFLEFYFISRDNAESHLEVIHLPGHTPGSIGILYSKEKMLCTGDMLFESFPMLDHYPGQGSRHDFKVSMEKIIGMINHGKVFHGILLPKLFGPPVRKNCSSDCEKLLKI